MNSVYHQIMEWSTATLNMSLDNFLRIRHRNTSPSVYACTYVYMYHKQNKMTISVPSKMPIVFTSTLPKRDFKKYFIIFYLMKHDEHILISFLKEEITYVNEHGILVSTVSMRNRGIIFSVLLLLFWWELRN